MDKHSYDVLDHRGRRIRPARRDRRARSRDICGSAVICKSLFGKAHTVMAEGGRAAAMGNVEQQRQLAGAFPGDTMRGGKFLEQLADGRAARQGIPGLASGSWRRYGAPVRPDQGRSDQPTQLRWVTPYPRLAHVGDRTGLELIRTMQQKIVSLQQDDAKERGTRAPRRAPRSSPK